MIVKKVREKRKYFTQDTEDAIIKYNSTSDFDVKIKYMKTKYITPSLN